MYESRDPLVVARERLQEWKSGETRDRAGESHPFRGNGPREYPDGSTGGTPGIVTGLMMAAALYAGRRIVATLRPDREVTATDRLAALVEEAENDPSMDTLDLCDVIYVDADLFCPRDFPDGPPQKSLPKLRGVPKPGSPASRLPATPAGSVDLGPGLVTALAAEHGMTRLQVAASRLRPTQTQLDRWHVVEMLKAMRAGNFRAAEPLIDATNYIVDGHNRWACEVALAGGKDTNLMVLRTDLGIFDALKEAKSYAQRQGLPQED